MKPPFAYYGGKTILADRIAAALPPHDHYVEPFAGSLAVLLAKAPSKMETVNDLDGDLMTFWRVLRDRPDDLARVASLTPHSRAEHKSARDLDGAPDDLERARRVWTVLAQGRTGTLRNTGWRYYADPAGSSIGMPGYLAGYVDRMPPAAARLRGVSLECRDALDVIRDYGRSPDVCIYADPPYLGSTRATGYRTEMASDAAHEALARVLNETRASVILSGYDSPLYRDLYDGWYVERIATHTGQGTGDRSRVEVLWSNRPPADVLDLGALA